MADYRPWYRLSRVLRENFAAMMDKFADEKDPAIKREKEMVTVSSKLHILAHSLRELADELHQSGHDPWMAEIRDYDLPAETIQRHIKRMQEEEDAGSAT